MTIAGKSYLLIMQDRFAVEAVTRNLHPRMVAALDVAHAGRSSVFVLSVSMHIVDLGDLFAINLREST